MTEKQMLVEMTVDQAIEFWETVQKLGIGDDLEAKQALLFQFVKDKKVVRAWTTSRTKEEIVADLKRNYGNVLDHTTKEKPEPNS